MAKAERFLGIFKERKNLKLLIIAAVGVALLIFSLIFSSSEEADVGTDTSLEEYRARLEGELAEICSSVEGAGKCRVMITFSEGERLEYKGSQLIGSAPPTVLGVTVLCRGAESVKVRGEITELVAALFNIGTNRICVLKLS